jgi:glucose/mannose-6-phosphate isomerase
MKQKLNPIDKSNLKQVIIDFPGQFKEGFRLAKNIFPKGKLDHVCISGMGGSSLPVDALRTYLENIRDKKSFLNIYQNQTYSLPQQAKNRKCLNIFCSYSGNTEETLAALNEAIQNKLPSVGLANDGKLLEICKKNNIPVIIVPKVSQPRYATGYFFASLLKVFANCGLIDNNLLREVSSSINQLKRDTQKLESKGKLLAKKIFKKTPVIHTTDRLKAIGRIGKIKINENAKTPCFYNYYPELNHNEMVGFSLPQAKFHILTLVDKKDNPQIEKRMRITAGLFRKKGASVDLIDVPNNKNIFLSLFSSLALIDWTSYYLALEYSQDPTPVDMVEDLKKMLS